MKTKTFMVLLLGVLVLGGGLGGSFAAGMALGKSKGEAAAKDSQTAQSTQSGQNLRQQLQDQFGQGQLTEEQLQQFRERTQGGGGPGAGFFSGTPVPGGGGAGFAGLGGLTGTIESISGNQITVNTAQGTLQATLAPDAAIQKFSTGTQADLKVGTQVTISGQRGTDGTVEARSVTIVPEGAGSFLGVGGRFQGRGSLTPTPQAGR